MKDNSLKKTGTLGQSIWLDYIRRDLIASDELRRMIDEDGLRGMTSNPSIFEKAIAESHLYDQDIHDLALKKNDVKAINEAISQQDVMNAADEFRNVYVLTDGKDGTIKRIIKHISPRETQVVALNKPSDRQQLEWYFQRYSIHLPVSGEFVLLNRSWYNRAEVEKVMDFCTEKE
ncbi:MAG: transaldolase family protein [Bacteroidales bacterium]|jgi:polyphosphate kinase 2 (PPK2 family)